VRLRAAALLAVIAMLSVSCGSRVRDDVWDELAAEDGTTPATTSRGGGESRTDSNSVADTATTLAAKRSNGSARQSGPGAKEESGPLPAPANGTYTWDESAGGHKQTATEQWSAQRQTDTVTLTSVEKRSFGGDSVASTTKYRVTHSAFEMMSDTSVYNDEEPDECTYKPPALVMPLPLKVGAKWRSNPTCAGDEPSDEDATDFEVTGTATDTIGGKQVKTFIVRGVNSYDTTDETTGERTSYTFTDTRHVDPATLLVVVEDVSVNFDGETNTLHRQLRSLTPA
jgi:hypothetical protein